MTARLRAAWDPLHRALVLARRHPERWPGLPGGLDETLTALARLLGRVEVVLCMERVAGCVFGRYPWDDWERAALAAGVPKELAGLGRLTMREAYQHNWDEELKSWCGWRDGGRRMIRLALRSPKKARQRWQRWLDTDGGRGEWKDGQWVSFGGRPQGL
jgi:hypothetical protein